MMREQIRKYAFEMMYGITEQRVPNKVDTINDILTYFYKCFRIEEVAQTKYKAGEDFNFKFEIFDDVLEIIIEGDLYIKHNDYTDRIRFDRTSKFCQSTNELVPNGFVGEVLEGLYKYLRKGAIML